ncbi:hypothetical protein ENSA5_50750 [Enhygromyxa salina]|uniref:Uncharacterized protein n=1 Tax=Enhygromyxa salina TaxID=215803 RepID=A0A2S9XGY1_9BACT|nr:hypothetical protein ENSA5_50750 [Enhygromyxa salina]
MFGLSSSGCKDPPDPDQRVAPPAVDKDKGDALKTEAYREALELALPDARAALIAADPLAAYQLGLAPAATPPLRSAERRALERLSDPARAALDELDESYLPGAEVVILRVMRFAFARINDDLRRRAPAEQDPMVGLHAISATLDELRYRLVHDDCDTACQALPAALAEDVAALRGQLRAASVAGVTEAGLASAALAAEARALASRPVVAQTEPLATGLEQLAAACDAHRSWLEQLALALPKADRHEWTAKPAPRKLHADAAIERLPAILGESALARRLSVEERIDLAPGPAFVEIERHVRRWQALRETLVGDPDPRADDPPKPVDAARCEAALGRLRAGLEAVPEVGPPSLDCARYVAVIGDGPISEGRLVLELLDLGVIEPQRRALRTAELPEVALVAGPWSAQVHTHLRRLMLLARLSEHAASAHAIEEARRALCLAEAALWIHARLGPPDEVALTVGPPCADIGDAATITARVTGDPRAALAGFGLSLIGDEPARMVGFDRFFWAPLGLMKILATPKGMHPDEYSLPDDPEPAPDPEVEVELEQL